MYQLNVNMSVTE